MSDSPISAVVAFLSVIGAGIGLAKTMIERSNARRLASMKSVPPSPCMVEPPTIPAPPKTPSSTSDLRRRVEALERGELDDARMQLAERDAEIATLRVRLAVLEAEVEDKRAIARDYARTAAELSAERERSEALRAEMNGLRTALDSGHTRLPLPAPQSDDRPTPPQGIRARTARPLARKPGIGDR